jgi:alkylation response protein AidB-like acyl-CoA dehydrogenase
MKTHLEGHLPLSHALAPQAQFQHLPLISRLLTDSTLDDLWHSDTKRLPKGLAQLRRKARAFAQQHLAPVAAELDLAEHLPAGEMHPKVEAVLKRAGQEGWLSYFLPWPLGSLPYRALPHPLIWSCALVVEEFSRVCGGLMLLLSAHHLGCMPLILSGQLSQILGPLRRIYQDNLHGNIHLAAFAITEPQAGSDVEDSLGASLYRPGLVATPTAGGYLLNGRKCFISGGDLAQSFTVFAALKGESMESWTCFYLRQPCTGFKVVRTELKMGMRASGAAELEFDNVFVPSQNVVGGLRQGWVLNRATLNSSRIPVASMGVGFAAAATIEAVHFARTFKLGGKALIDYQEVQLQLASMLSETRAIRSLIWQEARHSWQPRQLHASVCKLHATDVAQKVAEMALDLMGDRGSLHEYRVEKILRDLRLTRIFEGTNQINRLALIEDWQPQLLNTAQPVGV